MREGLHGLLGKIRPRGTSLIIEDVCVPPARIAEAAGEIRALLGQHGFLPGVAGHASAGNLHFMLTPAFSEPADRERYEAFMGELVELIVDKYDGSLKAEHGTGLNMAPWVEREWGPKATEMMWRIKELADPDGVLSPGVLLNRDSGVHLRNLKTAPPIEAEADNCVECGFCEPVCPSRDLTTTPRQRIVLRREMARQPAGSPVLRALLEEYEYDAIETCAADGTCMISCPLGIDTGKLVKDLRAREHGPRAERSRWRRRAAGRRWSAATRAGLRAGPPAARRGARPAEGDQPRAGAGVARRTCRRRRRRGCRQRARGRRRGLPAGVHQPDLRIAAGASGLPEALVAVSARAGAAGVDPGGRGGALLRDAVELEGIPGREPSSWRRRPSMRCGNGPARASLPVVTDASSCALGLLEDVARDETARRCARQCSIPWRGRTTRCCPNLRDPEPGGQAWPSIRRVRPGTWASSAG